VSDHGTNYNCVVWSSRPDYGSAPTIVNIGETSTLEGFTSLYQITEDSAKGIITAGTTAGFKGSVWSERLWIDLDSKETLSKTKGVLDGMGVSYDVWFTGNRGFHISIQRDSSPTHILPEQDKSWVKGHIPYADLGIYTHLHLFRLPGTVHAKTGARKTLVESTPGVSLVHAKYQRPVTRIPSSTGTMQSNNNMVSVFSDFHINSKLGRVRVGNRHHTLVSVCNALRDRGFELSFTRTWLIEMNKDFMGGGKSLEEIERVVQSIYQRQG